MNKQETINLQKLLLVIGAVTVVICLVITLFFRPHAFFGFFQKVLKMLTPFLYGAVIAYLLKPLCLRIDRLLRRLTGRKNDPAHPGLLRLAAVLLSLIIMLAGIFLILLLILPQLIESITSLVSQLPDALERFETWINTLDTSSYSHEVVETIQQVTDTVSGYVQNFLQKDLLPTLETIVTNVTSSSINLLNFLKNFGLGLIVSAYLLGSWEKFIAQGHMILYALLSKRAADWIHRELQFTNDMFSGFITGKVVDSLIVGIICFVFTWILGMPYALLVSVLVGVTNIIPFFGPYLGAIPSALLILTVSPVKCLIFLIFVIILQQFDGNILGPAILGDRVGLSGIWILFSILFFSSLFGFVGMLIGVPVFAVLYDLIRRFIYRCLRRRTQDELITEYNDTYHAPPEKERKKQKGLEKRKKKAVR